MPLRAVTRNRFLVSGHRWVHRTVAISGIPVGSFSAESALAAERVGEGDHCMGVSEGKPETEGSSRLTSSANRSVQIHIF